MACNDNKKNCGASYEQKKFGPFYPFTDILIVGFCGCALLIAFVFVETKWKILGSLVDGSEMFCKNSIHSTEQINQNNNKGHCKSRAYENPRKQTSSTSKFVVSNKDSRRTDDCSVDGKNSVPKSMRSCYFSVFMSPHFFGSSVEDGGVVGSRGVCFVVIGDVDSVLQSDILDDINKKLKTENQCDTVPTTK